MKSILLAVVFVPAVGLAGVLNGGGGKGIVCRDVAGKIMTAEVLDLYEGKLMYSLDIRSSSLPMKAQIKNSLQLIPTSSRGLVEIFSEKVQKNLKVMPVGTKLVPVDDAMEVLLPSGDCALEQFANYYNDTMILIDGEIWAALDERNRAALIMHESVYAANRIDGSTDSRQSRHVVANLFAEGTKWIDIKDQVPADAMVCGAGNSYFWVFKSDGGDWILQFRTLGFAQVMSKKVAVMSAINNFDFTSNIISSPSGYGTVYESGALLQSVFEGDEWVTITKRWEPVRYTDGTEVPGYSVSNYYFSWKSSLFPGLVVKDELLSCYSTH